MSDSGVGRWPKRKFRSRIQNSETIHKCMDFDLICHKVGFGSLWIDKLYF